jgi:hypothetical protein
MDENIYFVLSMKCLIKKNELEIETKTLHCARPIARVKSATWLSD